MSFPSFFLNLHLTSNLNPFSFWHGRLCRMSKRVKYMFIGLAGLVLLAVLIYQVRSVNVAVAWRADKFSVYVKNLIDPVGPVPTALPVMPQSITPTPVLTQTQTVATIEPTAPPTATCSTACTGFFWRHLLMSNRLPIIVVPPRSR